MKTSTLKAFQRKLENKFYLNHTDEIYRELRGNTPEMTIKTIIRAFNYAHGEFDEETEGLLWRYLEEYNKEVYTPWKDEQLHRKLLRQIRRGKDQFWGDHAIGYPERGKNGELKFIVDTYWDDTFVERYVSEEEFIELFL